MAEPGGRREEARPRCLRLLPPFGRRCRERRAAYTSATAIDYPPRPLEPHLDDFARWNQLSQNCLACRNRKVIEQAGPSETCRQAAPQSGQAKDQLCGRE